MDEKQETGSLKSLASFIPPAPFVMWFFIIETFLVVDVLMTYPVIGVNDVFLENVIAKSGW